MTAGRPLRHGELVIASHNRGKAREMAELFADTALTIVSAAELDLPEPAETGASFSENAVLKARAAARGSDRPALADDSGLSVDALDGAPGIYSARWAGPDRDFSKAMRAVAEKLDEAADRSAAFVCALAVAWPDDHVEVVTGRVTGTIVWPPRGDQGFGYDPIFVPAGDTRTFAEMPPAEKHGMSHRARAFEALRARCLAT